MGLSSPIISSGISPTPSISASTSNESITSNIQRTSSTTDIARLDLHEKEQNLLQKIGKLENLPSKTGISLDEAKILDTYITPRIQKWEIKLSKYPQEVLLKKKSSTNNLPRSLAIGIEIDATGTPKMRIIVLCKSKCNLKELPEGIICNSNESNIKLNPLGKGTSKVVKAALDWLTGDLLVQLIIRQNRRIADVHKEIQREFDIMAIISGRKGVVRSGFMRYEGVQIDSVAKKVHEYAFYFMHRYECSMRAIVNAEKEVFSIDRAIKQVDNLADSNVTFEECKIVYFDGKLSNTFVDHEGTLLAADFGRSMTHSEYQERLKKGILDLSPFGYAAPELLKSYALREVQQELIEFPNARDIWGSGIQTISIFAIGNEKLKKNVNMFRKIMEDLGYDIYNTINMRREIDVNLILDYSRIDDYMNFLFNNFEKELLKDKPLHTALKIKELLCITKAMLRGHPKDRITPTSLKRRLSNLLLL